MLDVILPLPMAFSLSIRKMLQTAEAKAVFQRKRTTTSRRSTTMKKLSTKQTNTAILLTLINLKQPRQHSSHCHWHRWKHHKSLMSLNVESVRNVAPDQFYHYLIIDPPTNLVPHFFNWLNQIRSCLYSPAMSLQHWPKLKITLLSAAQKIVKLISKPLWNWSWSSIISKYLMYTWLCFEGGGREDTVMKVDVYCTYTY